MAGLISYIAGDPQSYDVPRSEAFIVPLDRDDSSLIDRNLAQLAFQWYPSELSLTSESGHSDSTTGGLSHGLARWGSKPSRSLEITTIFTNDEPRAQPPTFPAGNSDASLVDFMDVPLSRNVAPPSTGNPFRDRASPDIRAAMQWLQSFQFPSRKPGDRRVRPPRSILLVLVNLGIGRRGSDAFRCTLRRVTFQIKSLWPSGLPRVVTAQLSVTESIQVGKSFLPHDASDYESVFQANTPVYDVLPRR